MPSITITITEVNWFMECTFDHGLINKDIQYISFANLQIIKPNKTVLHINVIFNSLLGFIISSSFYASFELAIF